MAHFEANFVPKGIEKQSLNRITSPDFIPLTSLTTLVSGYIFNRSARVNLRCPEAEEKKKAHLRKVDRLS
jgi:hypothetical protein